MTDKSESSDTEVTQRENNPNAVKDAIRILEGKNKYQYVKELGKGSYGQVFQMLEVSNQRNVAIKIVGKISFNEIELWPKLNHPNIIRLLEVITPTSLNVAIFKMPILYKSMFDMAQSKEFLSGADSIDLIRKWAFEILAGLEYLHSNNFCHLDLKTDNILLSDSLEAIISDFSFINVTTKSINRYKIGIPYLYRPPEACNTVDPDLKLNGKACDMWAFGVMLIELFTGYAMSLNISIVRSQFSWKDDVYPTLYKYLQASKFEKSIAKQYPCIMIFAVREAFNFVHCFLKSNHMHRMAAKQAMEHKFLAKGEVFGLRMDNIWIHKSSVEKFMEDLRQNSATSSEELDTTNSEDDGSPSSLLPEHDGCLLREKSTSPTMCNTSPAIRSDGSDWTTVTESSECSSVSTSSSSRVSDTTSPAILRNSIGNIKCPEESGEEYRRKNSKLNTIFCTKAFKDAKTLDLTAIGDFPARKHYNRVAGMLNIQPFPVIANRKIQHERKVEEPKPSRYRRIRKWFHKKLQTIEQMCCFTRCK